MGPTSKKDIKDNNPFITLLKGRPKITGPPVQQCKKYAGRALGLTVQPSVRFNILANAVIRMIIIRSLVYRSIMPGVNLNHFQDVNAKFCQKKRHWKNAKFWSGKGLQESHTISPGNTLASPAGNHRRKPVLMLHLTCTLCGV